MALSFYTIARLISDAKAIIRGGPATGIGTELGTDTDLILNASARMLQGAQVSAEHTYQQLDPATADAQRRDNLADTYGVTFEREATPARGLMAIYFGVDSGGDPINLPAGHVVEFPGELFGDGQARSYRTLQDVNQVGFYLFGEIAFGVGTSARKLRPTGPDGVKLISRHDILRVRTSDGAAIRETCVRRVNTEDQSVDLLAALNSAFLGTTNEWIEQIAKNVVVEVECTTPGALGNAPTVRHRHLDDETHLLTYYLFEASGGGEAVGPMDGDTARVVRTLEDTIAYPPSFANAQHLRELALACPDVDLDDALVYRGVRGRGTVDIVCIGRSGSIRSSAFPDVNLSYCSWGNNTRRIGDAQAARVQAWLSSKLGYFDDVLVRSVEWDWRGPCYAAPSSVSFLQAINAVEVIVTALDGYGPDSGTVVEVAPYVASATRLYAAADGDPIDTDILPGQRVWVTVGHSQTDGRLAYATVVTEVLNLDAEGKYATIADVTALGPGASALDGSDLVVLRWGSAGRLTQQLLDVVYAYYDQLGPGSYTAAPFGPGFAKYFQPTVTTLAPGVGASRWPPEGRRWASGVRASELRAALMAVEGVDNVLLRAADGNGQLIDYDPLLFQTCALSGCLVKYL
jgi:uncharacterized phage protein gp47/JayE